jgi:hypothetical protein
MTSESQNVRKTNTRKVLVNTGAVTNTFVITLVSIFVLFFWQIGIEIPKSWLAVSIALTTGIGIWQCSVNGISICSRFFILLYGIPFFVQLGTLWHDPFIWWETPLAIQYTMNDGTIASMLTIGLFGLLGLMFGVQLCAVLRLKNNRHFQPVDESLRPRPAVTLTICFFLPFVFLALALSWLASSQETIFTNVYMTAQTKGVALSMNFNAAFLTSYIIFVMCFVDMQLDDRVARKQIKRWILAVSILYTVVVLQLLRGDRECSGLLLAICALWITEHQSVQFRRVRRFVIPAACVFLAFLAIGFLRSELSNRDRISVADVGGMIKKGLTYNTWTGVSLTNLGLAEDYERGLSLKLGATYRDYILSLPPGIVAKFLGYQRPLDGDDTPNRWFEVAGGGIHPVVVPFANFGMVGAWWILAAIGFFISSCDGYGDSRIFSNRFFYGTVLCSGMLWFWYGDMNIIRAIMSYAISVAAYKVCLNAQRAGRTAYSGHIHTKHSPH